MGRSLQNGTAKSRRCDAISLRPLNWDTAEELMKQELEIILNVSIVMEDLNL